MSARITTNSQNVPQFHHSCTLKMIFAISTIVAVGLLVVLAIGIATVGAHQGWWNAAQLTKLSTVDAGAMLGVGGGYFLLGGMWKLLDVFLSRDRPSSSYLSQRFQELSNITHETIERLPPLYRDEIDILDTWLQRILYAVRELTGDSKIVFARKIQNFMKLAAENREFCDIFISVLKGSTDTCGDRLMLSFIHVDMQYQLAKIDRNNLPELAEFLKKKIWTIEMLDKKAGEHIESHSHTDHISVYLGFPYALNHKLDLQLDVTSMVSFSGARITDSDLDSAEKAVRSAWDDYHGFETFLIKNDIWMKALKERFPDDYSAAQVMLNSYEGDDFVQLEKEYDGVFRALTKQALGVT